MIFFYLPWKLETRILVLSLRIAASYETEIINLELAFSQCTSGQINVQVLRNSRHPKQISNDAAMLPVWFSKLMEWHLIGFFKVF